MKRFILSHKRKKSESSGGVGPLIPDLVTLGILKKPVSEYTNEDINNEEYSKVLIPYNDTTGKFSLNNGCIEFEVVGVNHHKDTNNADTPTITLMTKNVIRKVAFDAKEPNNPNTDRKSYGNCRWSVSNIRQWLNSSGAANSWFTPQHDYDEAPTTDNIYVYESADVAYASDPGFLAGFSAEVLQHFTAITNTTVVPNVDGGGSETTEDKVFLPSWTELIGSKNYGIEEGSHLSVRYPINDHYDYYKLAKNWGYWMRSPVKDTSYYTIYVDGAGDNYYAYAYDGNLGITPIIVLH